MKYADKHITTATNLIQLYDGALTYWEGGTYESWFGTVYAAHFLTEAKSAGYEIEKKFFHT